MADLAASDGAEGAEKLGNDREMSEHACAEAMRGPSLHEGGGDRAGLKEKSTDDGAKSASENQESGMCAGVSSSTPVTVVGQDAQGSSKTIADPSIDSPQPMDTASEDANEGEGVEHSGSGKEKSESDKASPTSDPEKKGAVLSGGVAEESAMHEHAPAVGASCGPCKEESGLGETVVGSVTEHAGPDDETGEDSDHYEDAPAGPDKDNSEGDNAAFITNPTKEEAEQPELTGDSGPVKYEDPSFDEDDLKGDGAESAVDSIKEEREPASLPTDDSPLFEDASSSYGPDSDSAAVAQVEKVPVVPVDQTDKVCGTSAGGLGEELEEMPSSSVLSSVAVATSSHKDQVEEGQHVDPSCGPPCHVQAKSWADDEPLVASPELEGGHQAAADDPSPGHPGDVSEGEEEAGEELELQLQPDELDYDSGIVEGGTTGPGEGDEEDEDECIEGERQQGDGEESVDPSDVVDKELDYDEDKRNPQYIPKKGAFYQHDDRMVGDEEAAEVQEEKKEDDKGSQRNKKKLWQDDGVWSHDMFNEDEQTPKSKEEIVATYGYDIRSETMPPRARRRRRYGRGPNKYQRNWEDEDAYSARPGFGRGGGSVRGGHRGRGGGPVGNPSFRDEDFPDLNAKPPSSGSAANQDTGAEHHRSSGGPPSQQDWDHSAGNSGQGRRGWGRRPQAQRRPSDGGSPKRPENELTKEVAPLNHRGGSKPAPRPPLKASEPLLHGAPGKARAGKHTPTEPERSLRGAELASKPASKMEAKEGGGGAESKNTAVVAPRTGPLGSTETTVKPKRYSSLRQRPIIEAASYTQEPAVVAPQGPLPQPGPDRPQPAILTAAHFQAPYSPYPDGYMLPPPGQAPAGMPPQSQPPAVMAAPGQIPGSFLPGPTGLVSFPPQYPPPYTFPAQYAPPAPAAQAVSHVSGPNIPQTQAQKPPYYHGDIIYYNTQSQQHKQRPTPARRPKAAIPIVPPPDSHGGGAQEVPCEPDGCVSHQSRSDEDLEDRGIVGAGPTVQEGVAGQQAVVEL